MSRYLQYEQPSAQGICTWTAAPVLEVFTKSVLRTARRSSSNLGDLDHLDHTTSGFIRKPECLLLHSHEMPVRSKSDRKASSSAFNKSVSLLEINRLQFAISRENCCLGFMS
jgi:hypothetical protein